MKSIAKFIHHIFIPSKRNNFRAKALHLDTLVLILTLSITLSVAQSMQKAGVLGFATDINIQKLYERTNQERTSHGLPALRYNNDLAFAAQLKAQDMFKKDYWAHYSPDGTSPWHFFEEAGYSYEYAGENLAQGFLFSDDVVRGWMESPTHRANILRPEYDEIGFATMNGVLEGQETTLVVQLFGKPISQNNDNFVPIAEAESTIPEESQTAEIEEDLSPTPKVESPAILAVNPEDQLPKKASFLSLDAFTFDTSLVILTLLLLVLGIDLIFAYRMKILRISGKNLAHGIFLTAIVLALFIIQNGLIL